AFVEQIRFDDSFETDMDMLVERMNDLIEVVMVDLDCVHAEDGLHLHGVHIVHDMHEADQSW
ncbi:hypothetical protein Tco_0395751, partial [Tanacetum coccineum]